jgi:hypothetical protein
MSEEKPSKRVVRFYVWLKLHHGYLSDLDKETQQ